MCICRVLLHRNCYHQLDTKFEVYIFSHSEILREVPKFEYKSRNLGHIPFIPIFYSLCEVQFVSYSGQVLWWYDNIVKIVSIVKKYTETLSIGLSERFCPKSGFGVYMGDRNI